MRAAKPAEPIAYPLVMALVVLPTASSRIGGLAHGLRHVRHLGDAAGVVRDRPVGVDGDDDAGHREHGHDRYGDAVQAGKLVGDEDAGGDDEHRQRGGLHGDGEALDDVGGVPGDARLGDALDRVVAAGGVVLGDDHDQGGDDDSRHPQSRNRRFTLGSTEGLRRERRPSSSS